MHSWRNAHSKPEPSIWNASKITMSGIFVKVIYSPAKWCEMASLGREPNQGFSCFITNYDDFITIHGRTWPSIKKFKLRRKNTILYFIQLLNSISRSTKLPDICLSGKEKGFHRTSCNAWKTNLFIMTVKFNILLFWW